MSYFSVFLYMACIITCWGYWVFSVSFLNYVQIWNRFFSIPYHYGTVLLQGNTTIMVQGLLDCVYLVYFMTQKHHKHFFSGICKVGILWRKTSWVLRPLVKKHFLLDLPSLPSKSKKLFTKFVNYFLMDSTPANWTRGLGKERSTQSCLIKSTGLHSPVFIVAQSIADNG